MKLAARSRPGQWQRWQHVRENGGEVRQRASSERRELRGWPGAQHGLGERHTWMQWSSGARIDEGKASAHPYLAHQMSYHGF